MIERIIDLPDNVLGFTATGEVTAEDYQAVLVPAIEEKLSSTKKVRLLYVLGEGFEGYTGAAAWEDAKVGLKHLTRFDRVAVVSDVDWIKHSVKVFGFVMPCEVRVFENDELQKAREWVSELPSTGTLSFEFLDEQGVLILRPKGELEVADFERVSAEIDPLIEKQGRLEGLMIVAEHFPGWDDLSAFVAHLRFVKDHRKNVARLAVVTNDRLLSALPHIASHFGVPEARHYPMDKKDGALAWVSHG
jgi:hypothetical protein